MLQTDFFLIKEEADEKQGGVLRTEHILKI